MTETGLTADYARRRVRVGYSWARRSILMTLTFASVTALVGCDDSGTAPPQTSRLQVPVDTGDGWVTGHPTDVGIRPEPLQELIGRIEDGAYANVHSVLIVRSGRLVLEAYFPGTTTADGRFVDWDRETVHELHSVTKSVNSLLLGLAFDRGLLASVDTPISAFFPDHASVFEDPVKARLTLRHFLSMTAGLDWDEHTHPYDDPRNTHVQLHRSGDPVGFTLRLPVATEPGTEFRYNSGLSITLGEVIRRASGLAADLFAERYLFGPLGITEYDWWSYPDGTVQTGGGLALKPRDMARLGLLVLDRGRRDGRQVVSEAWIDESTRPQAPGVRYGYQWWGIRLTRHEHPLDLGNPVIDAVAASGRGGQWVFVFPDDDLVVTFTGGNDNRLADQALDVLRRYVFPALSPS